jgi:hypothetical protein
VRHVHVVHEQVAVANFRDAAATRGAAMDRDELAENISRADLESGRLTPVFQVLWCQADRGIGKHDGAVADRRVLDDRVRANRAVAADPHARSNHRERPNARVLADYRVGMDARAGIDAVQPRLIDVGQQERRFHHRLPIHFGHRRHLDQRAANRSE